jgi:hypothetical protein
MHLDSCSSKIKKPYGIREITLVFLIIMCTWDQSTNLLIKSSVTFHQTAMTFHQKVMTFGKTAMTFSQIAMTFSRMAMTFGRMPVTVEWRRSPCVFRSC